MVQTNEYKTCGRNLEHSVHCFIITRKVVRKELLQEMGEFDWLRKHVLQIDNVR